MAMLLVTFIISMKDAIKLTDVIVASITGVLFSLGLIISGMVKRHLMLNFLIIKKGWNPALGFFILAVVIPNLLTFYLISRRRRRNRSLDDELELPGIKTIDMKLIIGSLIFGIGWGTAGLTPSTILVLFPSFFSQVLLFMGSMIAGSYGVVLLEKL
jgi:uncharacterized membrane protein YedE/YeeE